VTPIVVTVESYAVRDCIVVVVIVSMKPKTHPTAVLVAQSVHLTNRVVVGHAAIQTQIHRIAVDVVRHAELAKYAVREFVLHRVPTHPIVAVAARYVQWASIVVQENVSIFKAVITTVVDVVRHVRRD
jgi:hypothetical protein